MPRTTPCWCSEDLALEVGGAGPIFPLAFSFLGFSCLGGFSLGVLTATLSPRLFRELEYFLPAVSYKRKRQGQQRGFPRSARSRSNLQGQLCHRQDRLTKCGGLAQAARREESKLSFRDTMHIPSSLLSVPGEAVNQWRHYALEMFKGKKMGHTAVDNILGLGPPDLGQEVELCVLLSGLRDSSPILSQGLSTDESKHTEARWINSQKGSQSKPLENRRGKKGQSYTPHGQDQGASAPGPASRSPSMGLHENSICTIKHRCLLNSAKDSAVLKLRSGLPSRHLRQASSGEEEEQLPLLALWLVGGLVDPHPCGSSYSLYAHCSIVAENSNSFEMDGLGV